MHFHHVCTIGKPYPSQSLLLPETAPSPHPAIAFNRPRDRLHLNSSPASRRLPIPIFARQDLRSRTSQPLRGRFQIGAKRELIRTLHLKRPQPRGSSCIDLFLAYSCCLASRRFAPTMPQRRSPPSKASPNTVWRTEHACFCSEASADRTVNLTVLVGSRHGYGRNRHGSPAGAWSSWERDLDVRSAPAITAHLAAPPTSIFQYFETMPPTMKTLNSASIDRTGSLTVT